jgi:hypothetical protein
LDLCEQALAQRYPKAPAWPRVPAKRDLARVFELAMEAAQDPRRRRALDSQDQRLMRDFALPLELGQVEAAFVLGDGWEKHFSAEARRAGGSAGGSLSVGDLWGFIDRPKARGLQPEARDLLVRVYAAVANLALVRRGEALENRPDSRLGDLEAGDELRPVPLPAEADWKRAVEAAQRAFGVDAGLYRNAAAVIALGNGVLKAAELARGAVLGLEGELDRVPAAYRQPESQRRREAGAARALLQALKGRDPLEAVGVLAGTELPEGVSFEAIGRTWRSAEGVQKALRAMNWGLVDLLQLRAEEPRLGPAAVAILERLRDGLAAGQLVQPLEDALEGATKEATEFLKAAQSAAAAPAANAAGLGTAGPAVAGRPVDPAPAPGLESRQGAISAAGSEAGRALARSAEVEGVGRGTKALAGSEQPSDTGAGSRRIASPAELARLAEDLRQMLERRGALWVEWRAEDRT